MKQKQQNRKEMTVNAWLESVTMKSTTADILPQGEACHRKYKWLKVGGGQAYDWSIYNLEHVWPLYESGMQI